MCAVMVLPAPMLATNGQPTGSLDAWRIEPKLDGYRTVVGITPTELVVRTRRGRNITDRLPELARLGEIGVELVLDGELIDGAGRPEDFYGLAGAITARQRRAPLTFVAFDLLACNGNSMVERPQHERRRLLEHVAHLADGHLHIVPSYPSADLDALLVSADELSLEGLVLKQQDAPYRPGRRAAAWRKLKCANWAEHRNRRFDHRRSASPTPPVP